MVFLFPRLRARGGPLRQIPSPPTSATAPANSSSPASPPTAAISLCSARAGSPTPALRASSPTHAAPPASPTTTPRNPSSACSPRAGPVACPSPSSPPPSSPICAASRKASPPSPLSRASGPGSSPHPSVSSRSHRSTSRLARRAHRFQHAARSGHSSLARTRIRSIRPAHPRRPPPANARCSGLSARSTSFTASFIRFASRLAPRRRLPFLNGIQPVRAALRPLVTGAKSPPHDARCDQTRVKSSLTNEAGRPGHLSPRPCCLPGDETLTPGPEGMESPRMKRSKHFPEPHPACPCRSPFSAAVRRRSGPVQSGRSARQAIRR